MSCVLDSFDDNVVDLLGLVAGVTGSDATVPTVQCTNGSSNGNVPSLAARESTTIPEDQEPCSMELPHLTHGYEQMLRCVFIWVRYLKKVLLCTLTGCALSEDAKNAVVAKFNSACQDAIIYIRKASKFFQSRAESDNDKTREKMNKVQKSLATIYHNNRGDFVELFKKNNIRTTQQMRMFSLGKIFANKVDVSNTYYVEAINNFESELMGVITPEERGPIKVDDHDDEPEEVEPRHIEKRKRGRPRKGK